jgi:hypothetical protein
MKTGRITVSGQPGQNVSKTPSQQINLAWCFIPIIPSTQEAEVGELQSKNDLGKKHEILSEK